MKIAMSGLGRMGMNMVKRLLQGGHEVVAYNRTPRKTEEIGRKANRSPAQKKAGLMTGLSIQKGEFHLLPRAFVLLNSPPLLLL